MTAGSTPAPSSTIAHIVHRKVDGLDLCVFERGAGKPLLLIHGQFGDHLDWEPVLEPLSQHYRVIAPDLPGFGDSEKPDAAYDAAFFNRVLDQLLTTLGVEKVAVVGNSFGGQIAGLFALAYPQRVSEVVFVDSGGFREVPEAEKQFVAQRFGEAVLAQLTPAIHEFLFAPLFPASAAAAKDRYLAKQNAKLARPDRAQYARALFRSITLSNNTNLLPDLPRIRQRTLVLHGHNDPVIQEAFSREAAKRLANAELVVLENIGHIPQLEAPERFCAELHRFLG